MLLDSFKNVCHGNIQFGFNTVYYEIPDQVRDDVGLRVNVGVVGVLLDELAARRNIVTHQH